MRPPGRLLPHTVTITPKLGDGPMGTVWGDPFEARCRVEVSNRIVSTDTATEVVAKGAIFARPETGLGMIGSYVEFRGTEYTMIAKAEHFGRSGAVDMQTGYLQ